MRAFILAVTGLAIGVAACGSYGTSTIEVEKPASVAAVSITLPSPSLFAGQTQRANVAVKDANGVTLTNRPVVWYSSSTSVATVTDSGVIAGVSPGTATVSAVSEGVAGQAAMTVIPRPPIPVAKVLVAINPAAVIVGQTAQATVALEDSSGNPLTDRAVTWQSGNPGVATVSGSGAISAVAPGTAAITAASEGQTATASLSVSAPAPIPVATVSVSPASASVQVGATVQLSAVTRDANNNVLTGRVISWSSGNTGIATVSGSGLVTAVAAGSATITALSETKTGTSVITVTAPPPPPPPGGGSGWRGNEPAGMMLITDRPFNTKTEDSAWDPYGSNAFTIVTDATAPRSASNVMRATYPAGFAAGQAPAFTTLPHTRFAKIYICVAVKLSSNWVGNGSGVNKYGYLWTAPLLHPSFFFGARGSGGSTLRPVAFTQDLVNLGGGFFFDPNLVPTAQIVRGQWHVYEYFIQGNTSGAANGTIDWYLDGVHVGSVGGIQWTSGATGFDAFQFYPIWGGGNTSPAITATQTMDWDHVYISGKN